MINIDKIKNEINEKIQNSDISGAFDLLENELNKYPKNTDLLGLIADLHYRTSNFSLALEYLNVILKINPSDIITQQKIQLIQDIMYMMKMDIFESTNLYEPPNSMFSDGSIKFR